MRKIIAIIILSVVGINVYSQTPIPGHAGSISDGSGGAILNSPQSIFVSGQYVYVLSTNYATDVGTLEIADISNPSNPIHVGSISHGDGGAEFKNPYALFVSGDYAYIIDKVSSTFVIIDISNPYNPSHVLSYDMGNGGPQGIYVLDDIAYITTGVSSLFLMDVSNPESPSILSEVSGGDLGIFVEGDYAYVGSGNSLNILDISDPNLPTWVGSIEDGNDGAILEYAKSIVVKNGYAFVTSLYGDALEIIDVSIPTAPRHVSSVTNGSGGALLNNPESINVSGNYAFIVSSESNSLEIIDISNPVSPFHVANISDGIGGANLLTATSIDVSGNYAYISSNETLEIVDISTPSAPVHASKVSNGDGGALLSQARSVFVSDNYAYVTGSTYGSLEIIDISSPDNPKHKGNISHLDGGALLNFPNSVFVAGNYAYVASSASDALEIINIADPAFPVHTSSISDGEGGALLDDPYSVFVSGNFAYVASSSSYALEVINVSDPTSPIHSGSIALSSPVSVFVSGVHAYVALSTGALEIIDITDPTSPVLKGSISNSDGGASLESPVSVFVSGNYAYVVNDQTIGTLEIIDVVDPSTPIHAGSISNGSGGALLSGPKSVYVSGNYAFVASEISSSLEIVDISNPEVPVHAGSISNGEGGALLGSPSSVYVSGNYAYLASRNSDALEIVAIFTPTTPVAISATSITGTSFTANCDYVPTATSGYFLDVSTDNFSTFVIGYENLAGAQSISVIGLDPVTTYQYRFRAANPNGTSGNSNVITVATTPPSPVAIAPTNITETSFTANWEAVAGVDSYYLEVATNSAFSSYVSGFSGTAAIDATVVSQSITGLSAGIEYHYRVSSEIASTRSVPSNVISLFTASGTIVILPTTNVSESSFTMNWETLSGVTNYFITISTNADLSTPISGYDGTTALDAGRTSETVNGSSSGTIYYYQIVASTSAGSDAISSIETQLTYPSAPSANAASDVMSNSFVANWSIVTGADNYYLQVSVNNNFSSFIAGYDGTVAMSSSTTTETVSGLGAGITYFYRVIAENVTGRSDPSSSVTVATLLSNPVATNASGIGQDSFVANWEVVTGADEYELEVSTDDFSTLLTGYDPITVNTTEEFITGLLPETTYQYRVRAKNADGVSGNSNRISVTTIDVNNEAQNSTLSFENFGGTDISWNLFTIPYELVDNSVSTIFSNYDPARHEYDWKISRYSNSSNDYVNFNTGQVKLGEAYWFNAKENLPIKIGEGKTTAQIPFSLSLEQGWNLIGNPYTVSISWNKVLLDNTSITGVESLQVFKGAQQTTGDVMAKFTGGFVWSDQATTVKINPVTARSGGRIEASRLKIESKDIDEAKWMIPLSLINNDTEQMLGGFGMHPEASEIKDKYDNMAVPRFVLYNDLFTRHDEYFYSKFATDVVPTKSVHTWSFTLASNSTEGYSELIWNQQALQDKNSTLYLLDNSNGIVIDMSSQGSHIVNLNLGDFHFEIYFVGDGESFLPKDLMMGDAYPNPVSTQTIIPVVVPEGTENSEMDLSIYDINGRRVITLAKGQYAPGAYNFTWNVADEQRSIVDGMFFYRLVFTNNSFAPIQKKIIIKR